MSKWRVSSTIINGQKKYQVYRIVDDNEVDHSGNREKVGCTFSSYDLAMTVAAQMNGEHYEHR